jgi:diguanylate cyclase (GGDEF)-like protein
MTTTLDELERELEYTAVTRWITSTVAMFSILVVVVSGTQVLPIALGFSDASLAEKSGLVAAFLLNVALTLFAWRRSEQLKLSFAERDAAKRQAIEWAFVDDVTGLYNRRFFNQRFARLVASDTRPVALLLIDLDRFKEVNDLFGHDAGDEVLLSVSRTLREISPGEASCMRLGGDEFAVLLSGKDAEGRAPEELADRLIARLHEPIGLSCTTAVIGASIGIADYDGNYVDHSDLLRRSDMAMYESKRLGRNRWTRFDAQMESELRRRNSSEMEIRQGILDDGFIPFFQPVVELETAAVRGFEVLARWERADGTILEPNQFISGAEAAGVIAELSFSVMGKALKIARDWPQDIRIAVNISPVQFKDPFHAQRILKILAEACFPAHRLELEITERSLIGNHEQALATIESLRNCGARLVIDDFGIGYASLGQLRSFPFDRIKIDRSFVGPLLVDRECDAIVQSILTIGKRLTIPTTAEGVESEDVRVRLIELGCLEAQGWLFAKALSPAEVAAVVPAIGEILTLPSGEQAADAVAPRGLKKSIAA